MADDNYSERIDQYLDGELSGNELQTFESQISNDPQLEEELMANVLLREALESDVQADMRANIKNWRKENHEQNTGLTIRKIIVRLAAAASVLLVFGLAIGNLILPQYSNDAIAESVYIPETDLSGAVKGQTADVLDQALLAFENENYDKAMAGFKQYPDNDKAIYGLAQSYFLTNQFDAAIVSFSELLDRGNMNYKESAEYYLLLSYLKSDQLNEEFYRLLDKIASADGYYSEQAITIKNKLNSFWRFLR